MGFKPKNRVKHYQNIKSSYFIYPDDERVSGSSQFTDALIKQLIAKDKVPIVRFVPRRTSMVRFCALFPQSESHDADNFQTPPGFNLVFLPFADDIRKPDTVLPIKKPDVSREQITNAKLLVKSLTFEFDSRNFENPKLQTFFSNLQAIALGEENAEAVEDSLMPDESGMKKYSEVIDNFKTSVYRDSYIEPEMVIPKNNNNNYNASMRGKQKADDSMMEEEKPQAKKPRNGPLPSQQQQQYSQRERMDEDYGEELKDNGKGKGKQQSLRDMEIEEEFKDVEKMLKSGEVRIIHAQYTSHILKVQELKDYLKSKGIPCTGKKEQLIDKAWAYLASKK